MTAAVQSIIAPRLLDQSPIGRDGSFSDRQSAQSGSIAILSIMKTKLTHFAFALAVSVSAFAQEVNTNATTHFAPEQLNERALHRRAVEAVIWGMPAVNAELMFQAMSAAKADFNQVVYWSRPVTWKNQTLNAEPRHDLSHALLQHQGRRADGAGDSAGRRRRIDHRQHRRSLADSARRCRASRRG